ncbi:MAG: biosynthetic-type acetolactate synthase large subunit [Bacillota bacterium]
MSGAQAVMRCLEDEGVKVIFGIPGGAVLPVYDALLSSKIKHVLVRQEQAAAHAASGYARISGKPGVCMATSGPGATNLVTGIATAYMDSIPMVIFTGQVATGMVGTDAFQEVDITGITIPVTKHNYLVQNSQELPIIVKEALHIASTGRPGPVLVDIPRDVALGDCRYNPDQEVELRGYKPNYKGHSTQIRSLARMLREAERPVIYAGGGIISSNATRELLELAEKTDTPVTTTLMGIGAYPEEHPLSLGMLGLHGTPWANHAMMESDLIIAMGVRFADRVTGMVSKFAPRAKFVHLDIDPAEIGKNVNVDLPIVGDIQLVLQELLPQVEQLVHQPWKDRIYAWRKKHPLTYGGEEVVRPQLIIEQLGRLTRGRAIITSDVGQHQMWTAQYYKFNKPRTFLCSGGLGTMGYGFPAAVGAQFAAPDSLVVAVTGDGSFQMHMAELGTAVENDLPIKILIFNNGVLGMVRQLQHFYCDRRYGAVHFSGNPDFVKLAACYGAEGLRIERSEQVVPVLEEALNNNKLTIIDCQIAEEEMVFPMVPSTKALNEMIYSE